MAAPARKLKPAPAEEPNTELSIVETKSPQPAPAARTPRPRLSVVEQAPKPKPENPLLQWAMSAVENSRSNTFFCDHEFNIVYANKKSFEILNFMEPNLRKFDSWKHFRANDVVGMNLEFLFTDEPLEFRRATDPRNHPYQNRIQTGPCICDVQVTTIKGENGDVLGFAVDWERITEKVAQENRQAQLLSALEGSKNGVMITDADLKINYMNKTLGGLLKSWEADLQKLFGTGFHVDALLGRCLDDFHKNPAHQRKLLANESIFPYQTVITVGPYKIDLGVNMIKGKNGEVMGYCTEWQDVTERLLEEEDYKANVKMIADRMEFLRGACSTDLAEAMDSLANGNLTFKITPKTPLLDIPKQPDLAMMAETFNNLRNQTVKTVEAYGRAQEALSTLVAQTRTSAERIADASTEVSTGTDDLSQRTEEQASSLEETASSMEQMTSTVKQNADNARQANQLAAQASDIASKGGAVVSNAVTSMEEINKASKRIADIISVIDEIAFQTNLLALNAAVEAARVGEQGRGFAVVAAEVRNLAGRSATAAKEIKALVQDSVAKVQEGSNLVNQSGLTLDEIVNSVKKVADIIAEITAASQEQAAGIEQVNKAIMQMDQITQQNAALVEETAAASQAMTQQAGDLRSLVSQFQLDASFLASLEQGAPSGHAPSAPAARPKAAITTPTRTMRTSEPPRRATAPKSEEGFEEF
ncbi:MAG TPA: methyl-accepting chemotaxis protein [Chthonomonadaceae bacterium]|nr:methyl-accepting chemotaxis protein [Chthonomonadaceae bacterium]